jgi:hypothetical protein
MFAIFCNLSRILLPLNFRVSDIYNVPVFRLQLLDGWAVELIDNAPDVSEVMPVLNLGKNHGDH